jgi:hypothetical protein
MPAPLHGHDLQDALRGVPVALGVIASTSGPASKNNHTTSSAFNNTGEALSGKVLTLYASAAGYIAVGSDNSVAATSSSFPIAATTATTFRMRGSDKFLAFIAASGTANLSVFEAQ